MPSHCSEKCKYLMFPFNNLSFSKANHLEFIHNVFEINEQVNFNFGYYAFYGSRIMHLFILARSGGINVLWTHSSGVISL